MKYGAPLSMRVTSFDERGRGIGHSEAKATAAAFVIPGETVDGLFVGRAQGLSKMGNVRVREASPDRVKPECPHAGVCGGCAWQHVRYERQLEEKRRLVVEALSPVGAEIGELVPAEELFRHRNRMDFVFGPNGELGLKQPGRWDRHVDLSTCLMLSPAATDILRVVRAWAQTTSHAPWDNRRHQGFLRYLVIREGKYTGERMVALITAPGELEKKEELIAALSPFCTSLLHGINPLITDLSLAHEVHPLKGEPLLRERIGDIVYRIHPNAFFQTNSRMAGRLLERVRAFVLSAPHARLLDLYCGGGFFSLALAKDVEQALGVELDAQAIAEALASARENGVTNVRYRAEAAEQLSWETEQPDVVIVDPPRSGLHPRVKKLLLEKKPPRIVYVSCKPRALGLDLKDLLTAYRADPAVCVDLFPHTPHIETVVQLTLL